MKLPYRAGDSFALPVGNGTTIEATIVAHDHHTVDIAVSDLTLRVSDRALVLHRWKTVRPTCGGSHILCSEPSPASCGYAWIGAAHAERIVATHLGIANVELPPLHVHNRWRPEFPPDSRYVRIAEHGTTLDPRELASRYPNLEVLECSGVTLASLEFPPTLRALRLAWVATPVDLHALKSLHLETLSLEELRHLRGTDALARMESLRQLEMLGFWQLTLDDVMPLVGLRNLVRAEIDIGGRRKNVELYKRATWAYPWPFEILARL
jgi:hypothetical protein